MRDIGPERSPRISLRSSGLRIPVDSVSGGALSSLVILRRESEAFASKNARWLRACAWFEARPSGSHLTMTGGHADAGPALEVLPGPSMGTLAGSEGDGAPLSATVLMSCTHPIRGMRGALRRAIAASSSASGRAFAREGRICAGGLLRVSQLLAGDLPSPGGAPTPPGCRQCECQHAGAAPARGPDFLRSPATGFRTWRGVPRQTLHPVRPALTTPREAPLSGRGRTTYGI
jgi:hypothetical protein